MGLGPGDLLGSVGFRYLFQSIVRALFCKQNSCVVECILSCSVIAL